MTACGTASEPNASSQEFQFLESGAIQYSSRAAIRAALGSVPQGTRISTSYRDLRIDAVAPGVAVASALFERTFANAPGQSFSFAGALTLVWVHEAGGWRIRSGHSSAPVPRGGPGATPPVRARDAPVL
jgi:ketosteroid isomerase-like protein